MPITSKTPYFDLAEFPQFVMNMSINLSYIIINFLYVVLYGLFDIMVMLIYMNV